MKDIIMTISNDIINNNEFSMSILNPLIDDIEIINIAIWTSIVWGIKNNIEFDFIGNNLKKNILNAIRNEKRRR